ncbi:MAG: hypothetical protein Q8891_04330 [Bacteroidota bacterium]|nr:hypothetical protein [Bacteroidota bacterium]
MILEVNIISIGILLVIPYLVYVSYKIPKETGKKMLAFLLLLYVINLEYLIHCLRTLH